MDGVKKIRTRCHRYYVAVGSCCGKAWNIRRTRSFPERMNLHERDDRLMSWKSHTPPDHPLERVAPAVAQRRVGGPPASAPPSISPLSKTSRTMRTYLLRSWNDACFGGTCSARRRARSAAGTGTAVHSTTATTPVARSPPARALTALSR
jgi:hypothetical protein